MHRAESKELRSKSILTLCPMPSVFCHMQIQSRYEKPESFSLCNIECFREEVFTRFLSFYLLRILNQLAIVVCNITIPQTFHLF